MNRYLIVVILCLMTWQAVHAGDDDKPAWVKQGRWISIGHDVGIVLTKIQNEDMLSAANSCIQEQKQELEESRQYECNAILSSLGKTAVAEGYLVVRKGGIWVRININNQGDFTHVK